MSELKLNPNFDELLIEWIMRMPDEEADKLLVDKIRFDMRKKLKEKREEGKCGWYKTTCNNDELKDRLIKNINDGDMIDVINLAAMIHCRTILYGKTA